MSETTAIHRLLQQHFGFREFLEGQEGVVQAILDGQDAVVIMPTGGGKSLCYQLPALTLEGITVVVSPLIALMKDQVDGLTEKKIPATFINSTLSPPEMDERVARMQRGEFRLVYIAPERFKSERFVRALAPLSIALFAVDEAHCISQWGHDFRPDYIRLKWALKDLGQPRVIALTATATPEVREDIIEQLGLGKFGRQPPKVFVSGFARHNLTLAVSAMKSKAAKLDRIARFVQELKTGIIYCATRKNVDSVAEELQAMGVSSIAYHAGMTESQRTKAQATFMDGQCNVAVATNAFGMGIDRPDLRFVLHFDIPGSVEAYYQEAGRAGRDGEPARCEILYNYADVRTQEFFVEGNNPTREVIEGVYNTLLRLCGSGPVESPIAEIAKQVAEAENDMAVGTSLYLLGRAGFITRYYQSGSRTYTTQLVKPIKPLDLLEIDFDRLEAKYQRDLAKLERIIAYADERACRHQFILKYFGDTEASEHCNVCDNCLAHVSSAARLPTEEETVIIQKALSCVARLNGRFGRARIAQTLLGERTKAVLDAGLDRLSTFSLLSELDSDYVWNLLDVLIKAGCIASTDDKYHLLSLTQLGGDIMRRKTTIPMALPQRGVARVASRAEGKAKRSSKKTQSAPQTAAAKDAPYPEKLYQALRDWRREKAAASGGLPEYLVYPNETLKEICRRMPQTEDELLEVRGIGPAKARQFGRETLELIRSSIKP